MYDHTALVHLCSYRLFGETCNGLSCCWGFGTAVDAGAVYEVLAGLGKAKSNSVLDLDAGGAICENAASVGPYRPPWGKGSRWLLEPLLNP